MPRQNHGDTHRPLTACSIPLSRLLGDALDHRAHLRLKRRAHGEPVEDLPSLPEGPVVETGIDEQLLAELPVKLAALSPRAQIVLPMHYLQSLTQRGVAEALEIPIGTVKSLAHRLRAHVSPERLSLLAARGEPPLSGLGGPALLHSLAEGLGHG
ncbi:MAG TPA: sigma factor-like helix-turn-helix DNA-binding protein [Thermoanaerobaculia bacterium]|nr:sigma factor-like helix-turn-helix DNA-binding protein [Thermoanaerobaculia bacterium]